MRLAREIRRQRERDPPRRIGDEDLGRISTPAELVEHVAKGESQRRWRAADLESMLGGMETPSPEAGSAVNEAKEGTSPLPPGFSCVDASPAAPLSNTDPLLLPSNPSPVTS